MKKRTYRYPDHIMDMLEKEAKKRLIEMNYLGTKLLGSVCRDIICVLIEKELKFVSDMSIREFKAAVKEAKEDE